MKRNRARPTYIIKLLFWPAYNKLIISKNVLTNDQHLEYFRFLDHHCTISQLIAVIQLLKFIRSSSAWLFFANLHYFHFAFADGKKLARRV